MSTSAIKAISQLDDNDLARTEEAHSNLRQLFSGAMPKDEIGALRFITVSLTRCYTQPEGNDSKLLAKRPLSHLQAM